MKQTLCLFAIFLLLHRSHAQCDSVFFRYTGTFIYDVSIIDTTRILAVGDNGYIIKSKDGGQSWKNIRTFNSNYLKAIQLASDSIGYSVGNSKTILKTEDQGESWFPLFTDITTSYSTNAPRFNGLYFFSKDRGYIVGDGAIIISTNNGGRNWNNLSLNTSERFNSITFLNDSTGFICGTSSSLYKTINGGRTWQKITLGVIPSSETLNKVTFINSTTGFVIGSNSICLKTVNSGATWTKINTVNGGIYYGICFLNPLKGFIVATSNIGYILQTNDGGNTWSPNYNLPGQPPSFYCIGTDPGKKKIVMAGGGSASESLGHNGRTIYSTSDAGTTYTPVSLNRKDSYGDSYFLNDSTGYVGGAGGMVLKTSDCGESWKPLQTTPAFNSGNSPRKLFYLDSLRGFASTDNFFKTSDGGITWMKMTTPGAPAETQYNTTQMYFFDTLKGLVQNTYTVYKTINGGSTWTNVLNAAGVSFYTDFTATAAGKVFAVGYYGKMDVSTDEGTTWTPFNLNTSKNLTSVYFYNNLTGYIGTADTTIFKTTDGGNSWTKINTGIGGRQMRSIRFMNDSIGYMITNENGGTSNIYKTKNGGLTWFFTRFESENLSRLAGLKTIYITGGNGLIVKTDTLQKPGIPGYIYGPDKNCINDYASFITAGVESVNYNWSLSGGGSNVSNANKDTVLWNSAGLHTLSVSVSNACGVSPSRQITTDVIVFQPTITVQQDSVLTATEGLSYLWLRNGIVMSVAEGVYSRTMIARYSGVYTVQVKSFYGCTVTTPPVQYIAMPVTQPLCPGGGTSIDPHLYTGGCQWQRDDGTGFVNISDNSFYSGTNFYILFLTNIPSSWYGYKFRCVISTGFSDVYTLKFINYWNGSAGTAWEDAANWSCGTVPDANTDVVISSGTVVIHSNIIIRKLTINPAVSLTVQSGNTLTITH